MKIQQNISLKSYNSFHCECIASHFSVITQKTELIAALDWCKLNQLPFLVLGGGSNMLFTKNMDALVLKMEVKGIQKINETSSNVFLNVGAGEHWHHFVTYTVQKSWGGLENLSLIPGTVGAAPIQNIGAYGAEVKNSIISVTAYDTHLAKWITLTNEECAFEYRNSIFKKEKNRYIIWEVQFCLQKQPQLNIEYGAIREKLHDKQIKQPSLEDIANAIIQIRTEKLPDPKLIGNAGSFFKNPIVEKPFFEKLKLQYPTLIAYPISDQEYKIAAGWLIEQAGWKGKKIGNIGCYEKQALVIVNYGNGTGKEVFDFSEKIIESIKSTFGIVIEREVNIY
jgi:UDP-N-acetylmuramate dehydrogenase